MSTAVFCFDWITDNLRRKGVRVVSITEHADDSPTGKLMEAIIESVDEFYSENLAQEVTRGMRESASRGFWVSSYAPFGYNRVMVQDGPKKRPTLEPDRDASRIVKRIFEMAEAGKGMVNITSTLNDEGIASPRGKLWGKTSVHAILINEAYTGTLVWGTAATDGADPVRVERAFPSIVSKAQFRRVNARMRSRSPRITHPRRVASSYMFSGLVKCYRCETLLSGQDAKSGRFHYYVCQSLLKRGKDGCDTPRLNARRFEELIVRRIRSSILTEAIIGDLAKVVAKELESLVREQRRRLETIESELADVRRRLGRLWDIVETTDDVPADTDIRIQANTERRSLLEASLKEAQSILSQRKSVKDDLETIVARAQDMGEFLKESELSERKTFAKTFVREIVVMPGKAMIHYAFPMPGDSHTPGANSEEVPLDVSAKSAAREAQ